MAGNFGKHGFFPPALSVAVVILVVAAAVADVPDAVQAPNSWLNVAPGGDATQLNFSWATRHADTTFRRGPEVQMVNTATGETATFHGVAERALLTASGATVPAGWYQNRVTVTGLAPSTGYRYRVGYDTVWSDFHPIRTGDRGASFNFIAVGDPQLGAKTSPAPAAQKNDVLGYDSAGWRHTVDVATRMFPKAGFLLSAGDQVESTFSQAGADSQYNAYFSPLPLLSLPVAVIDGNHDYGLGQYFGYHYYPPNRSTEDGATAYGNDGDYWFSYGKALFMVLNSNAESAATHDVFIGKAIAANPGALWKIVSFHHSLYSDGSHISDAVLFKRNAYPPILDKYKIDVVLSGHDHSYTRSYQMLGGMPVSRPGDSVLAVNPRGTLYMTLNSGSGSKYYQLNPAFTVNGVTTYPAWSAVFWQQNQPTFSDITISADSFSIVTYAITDNRTTRIDGYTIVKNGAVPAAAGYSIVNRIPLSGDGGWDYCTVDDSTGRLFVSHGNEVQVVELATRTQVGAIPDTRGVHGIALAHERNEAYISDGKDTAVTVADLTTLAVQKKIHVTGLNPDAIIGDPFSHCVFTCNGKTGNATVIDTKTDSVTATIPLGGKPEFPASSGDGKIYVNLEDKDAVAVVDMKSMKVEKRWSVAPGTEPSAMAIDNRGHRLFIGCHNRMMVIMDAKSGKVIATPPIGDRVDAAVFDPATGRAFSSNGDGTITVIGPQASGSGYEVVETIATQTGARTMAISLKTHHLYLPAAEYDSLPPPTPENPTPRRPIKPGSFVILEVAPVGR